MQYSVYAWSPPGNYGSCCLEDSDCTGDRVCIQSTLQCSCKKKDGSSVLSFMQSISMTDGDVGDCCMTDSNCGGDLTVWSHCDPWRLVCKLGSPTYECASTGACACLPGYQSPTVPACNRPASLKMKSYYFQFTRESLNGRVCSFFFRAPKGYQIAYKLHGFDVIEIWRFTT